LPHLSLQELAVKARVSLPAMGEKVPPEAEKDLPNRQNGWSLTPGMVSASVLLQKVS
jgi:hypothetical protein